MSIMSGLGLITVVRADQSVVVLVKSTANPSAFDPWIVVVDGLPLRKRLIVIASATE